MVQQNAGAAEEMGAMSAGLQDQAAGLQRTIGFFAVEHADQDDHQDVATTHSPTVQHRAKPKSQRLVKSLKPQKGPDQPNQGITLALRDQQVTDTDFENY